MTIVQKFVCNNRSKLPKSFKNLPKCRDCLCGRASGGSCRFLGELLSVVYGTPPFITLAPDFFSGCRTLNEDTKEVSFRWGAEETVRRPQVFNRPITINDIELKAVRE